jgi:NADH:ubiquinone oxidoreductase subunit E
VGKQQQKCVRQLTGHFLGWGDTGVPHRYIRVATANGELLIKVGKQLRPQIQDWEPGIWLAMMSQERIDMVTGEIKIKVKQLLTLPTMATLEPRLRNSVEVAEPSKVLARIQVCQGSSCRRRGSEKICQMMQSYLDRYSLGDATRTNLTDRVEITPVKCLHQCKDAPHIMTRTSAGAKKYHHHVKPREVKGIMMDLLPSSRPLESIDPISIRPIINNFVEQILATVSIS